jgi:large subunit ribosomal protein L25
MATVTEVTLIEAEPRNDEQRGKNEARRLRAQGRIPAVLYGARKDAVPVSVDPKQISRILTSESGHNTIFDLQVGSEKSKAMIVDWQYEPIKGKLLHIDLKRIAMDERLRVKVPIMLLGEPAGVKQQGGILEQILREVELECLPTDIPSHIDVDVSELVFGQVLRVSNLPHGGKVKFVTDENQPVAHITAVKEEVAPTPEAAAEAAAAPAEPEVIKKGKQETEEGAAAEAEAKPAEKPEKPEKKEKR